MKASIGVMGLLIASAATAVCFHAGHQRNAKIEARLRVIHAEELHKRYRAELESDRMERESEKFLWDVQIGLAQRRALIAQELAADLVLEKASSQRGDPPDPGIALERAALARIDARLQELKQEAEARNLQN